MPTPPIEPPEELRERREVSRRATRRHRLQAAGLITLLVVTVGAILLGDLYGIQAGPSVGETQTTASPAPTTSSTSDPGHAPRPATASTSGAGTTGPPGTGAVPILMYHVIAAPPPGAPFPGLYVVPSEFAAQMQALKDAGWHAVTLDEVQAYWQRGVSLGPGKPIVVSFDNGYQSQYTQALPVLRRLGWVGDENIQLTGLPPSQGGLSQAQIRGLVAAGWELDTQGISHADLITLDGAQLHDQVAVARRTVQQRYRRAGQLVLLPLRTLRRDRHRRRQGRRLHRLHDRRSGLGSSLRRPLPPAPLRVLGETSPAALLAQIADIREDPPAPASYNGA